MVNLVFFFLVKGKNLLGDFVLDDDLDIFYQYGSVKYFVYEMYFMRYYCLMNLIYDECIYKCIFKKCNDGFFNICFIKSIKRNDVVYYYMGCVNYK